MFHQQHPHLVPPVTAFQPEIQAKEKLAVYVYEYLVLTGASKTAELFKQEKLAPQGIDANVALDSQPCFLQDWFLVFWDLYCASPDQRNRCESSWEAKEFHDRGFIPPSVDPYPMENGMNGIAPQIGNYHHHHPGMSSHSAHPMHNGYYHPPSYMNHQPGPSHLNPPINHSNRGRKRAKTEKPQERNFADSEESINRLRGPPPPYVPRDQKPLIVKEEPQEMMPQVMIPLKTEEKIHNFIPTSCARPPTLFPSTSRSCNFKPVVVPPRYEKPSIITNVPARPKTQFHSYSPQKCSSERMTAQKQQPKGDRFSAPKEPSCGVASKDHHYEDIVIKVDSEEDSNDSQIQELVDFMDGHDDEDEDSSEPSP
ncbi:single-stranded DNA-binding protein 3 [Ditylenchus destructor]|nr:single-stranded DNA-binding protein 3 [Ditylenchus destructor]